MSNSVLELQTRCQHERGCDPEHAHRGGLLEPAEGWIGSALLLDPYAFGPHTVSVQHLGQETLLLPNHC